MEPVHPKPFVGRRYELQALCAELEAALLGRGRWVVLEGEAGIGKTRLAGALALEAEQRGARVLWGRCPAEPGAPELWPWRQVLRACAERDTGDEAAELLARLDTPTEQVGGLVSSRFARHDAATRALARASQSEPLVIVLDDWQWADAGSRALLDYAAAEWATAPLLVVTTKRPERAAEASDEPVGQKARAVYTLKLGGLSEDEIAELLSNEIHEPPAAALVEAVAALTAGNPFFVGEMGRYLVAAGTRGTAEPGPPGLPDGVSDLLRQRLDTLPTASRRLLAAAAVRGLEFELGTVARALDQDVATLASALEAPRQRGVVRAVPDALQRYTFVHAIMRDALLDLLPAEQMARLHGALGHAIAEQGGDPAERLPALAHHFFEAARLGDPAPALRYACEAGEWALARGLTDEAAQHFERAREALSLVSEATDAERLRVAVGLGLALHTGPGAERGQTLQREAIELARGLDAETFAETVLRVALRRAEVALLDVETNALLEQALSRLPPAPSVLRARLLARLAAGLYLDRHASKRRDTLSREAVEMAQATGSGAAVAFARSRRLMALLSPDHLAERLALAGEILRDPATPPHAELEARLCQLDDLAESGDRPALDAAFAAFEQKAEASPSRFVSWQLACARAGLALLEGRLSAGEELARRALALGARVQPESAGLQFAQQLLWLRGWQARLPEIAGLIEGSVEKSRVVPAWRSALAAFYVNVGREAEARRELDALASDGFESLPRDGTWITGMTLIAEVCVRLGDVERAATLYDLLLPYRGRIALARPLVVMPCLVDQRLAALAQTLGRLAEAGTHLEDARQIAERMRGLPLQAEIHFRFAELARVRGEAGDHERAVAWLQEAEQIARPLGLHLLTGWIEASRVQLARGGARLSVAVGGGADGSTQGQSAVENVVRLERVTPPDATATTVGRFRREGDVWTLEFDGRSSRLRDMRGLGYLGRLIAEPGREVHASELAGAGHGADLGDAGEALDRRARAEYERRLAEARDELAEAERMNDRGRMDARTEEIELLYAELSRGFGIGGRERREGSASERARVNVTRAIKYAVDKIGQHDPVLADHLRGRVRTGTFCSYAPDARDRVHWVV